MADTPNPIELWRQADGDGAKYRDLLREHGMLLSPGDEGYEDASRDLPCGWPHRGGAASQPSITCPACGMTSYHPDDIREGYCGNCHDWTGPGSKP